MNAIRPPAVAGAFYPGDPQTLTATVDRLLAGAEATSPVHPKALIVPHAGYIYSGPMAARGYASLLPQAGQIRRVILLGPTHRVAVRGLALPESEVFATPLGVVPLDTAACAALSRLPQVVRSEPVHAQEHSLEVHLPFLQRLLGDFSLVPLAVGVASPEAVAEVVDELWGGPETLIVISSDLSHYHSYRQAQFHDQATIAQIRQLDATLEGEQACGAGALNGLLLAARRHHLTPHLLDLRNSGDTAGDRSRVVGYASIAFSDDSNHAHH